MKLLTHSKNSPSNPLQRLWSGDSSMFISVYIFLQKTKTTSAGFFKQSMEARNRVGIGLSFRTASLRSLAGWYDNTISTRFLDPIDCFQIQALYFSSLGIFIVYYLHMNYWILSCRMLNIDLLSHHLYFFTKEPIYSWIFLYLLSCLFIFHFWLPYLSLNIPLLGVLLVEQNLFFHQIEAEEIALGELSHISAKNSFFYSLWGEKGSKEH